MKKYIFIGLGVLLVALIGLIVAAVLNLGTIIKVAVEEVGPRLTQSEIKLGSADISFLSGSGGLDDLYVGNPKGFTAPSAIEVGSIKMSVDKDSLTKDTIIIKKIEILSPEITYEKKGSTDNFKTLIANVNKAVASEKKEEKKESAAKDEGGSEKNVIIENLIIKNGKVNLAGGMLKTFGDKGMNIALPDIHLKDIGKKKKTTFAEAFALVLNEMTKGIGSSVGDVAKTLTEGATKALESGKDALQGATEGLQKGDTKGLEDAAKGIKSIFGD
ncbi:AsmA family protein [Salidesulfovibrio onnuriiensis]|uniref:AsmA family protein n=1 Tax=Salidesulfovibrio onnuriiensis TaxID=2583823 RepID=UPI0011C8D16C|nr:AsmA family protein [Salidesulfovibrio onnuriiensis]